MPSASAFFNRSASRASSSTRRIRPEVIEALFNAPADQLVAAATACGETGCVLVVAHNPGLHEAALQLLAQGGAGPADLYQVRQGMPTATAGVFDVSGPAPRLLDWLCARDFGGGAGE